MTLRLIPVFWALLSAPPSVPPKAVAVLGDSVGPVSLRRGGKAYGMKPGTPLYATDVVETGEEGKARILLKDDSVLSLGPRSRASLERFALSEGARGFTIKVFFGRFKMTVAKWLPGPTEGEVQTPTSVAGVRGTVLWGDTDLDAVCSLEGEVHLVSRKGAPEGVDLAGGTCATGMKGGKTAPLKPSADDLKRYLAEVTIP